MPPNMSYYCFSKTLGGNNILSSPNTQNITDKNAFKFFNCTASGQGGWQRWLMTQIKAGRCWKEAISSFQNEPTDNKTNKIALHPPINPLIYKNGICIVIYGSCQVDSIGPWGRLGPGQWGPEIHLQRLTWGQPRVEEEWVTWKDSAKLVNLQHLQTWRSQRCGWKN